MQKKTRKYISKIMLIKLYYDPYLGTHQSHNRYEKIKSSFGNR